MHELACPAKQAMTGARDVRCGTAIQGACCLLVRSPLRTCSQEGDVVRARRTGGRVGIARTRLAESGGEGRGGGAGTAAAAEVVVGSTRETP